MKIKISLIILFIAKLSFSAEGELREYLLKQYEGSKIVFNDSILENKDFKIESLYEIKPGILKVIYISKINQNRIEKEVHFEALKPTFISKHRIKPGEPFNREDFKVEELNLTEPLIREVRSLLLPPDFQIEKYEARVTVLEGQFPISSGVQKIPAAKRGDLVKILLKSGELELSVPGVVQEPAQMGGTLKVLTSSTKREITGTLKEGKIVEVIL